MGIYNYEKLKSIAKKVRVELLDKGLILEKKTRRKPRDTEKIDLLYTIAMNRLKKYPPRKTEKGIILPYFRG